MVGAPGSGVPLAVSLLARLGLGAVAWEGGADGGPELDPDGGWPGPTIVALEARDLACLERSASAWSADRLPSALAAAAAELEVRRGRLQPLRLRAQVLLDSGWLEAAELERRLLQLGPALRPPAPGDLPLLVLESFAYPRGLPLDLSWCLDARALRNPYWEERLRPRSGLDPEVREFVLAQPVARAMLAGTLELLQRLLPELAARQRRVLRLGVGCTGGFHRSVALLEALAGLLREVGIEPLLWHRDLPRQDP